jgi:pilus assembly protein Flp/PilA
MPEPFVVEPLPAWDQVRAGGMGVNVMINFVSKFVRDESGASAAEYALILVVIGIAIVAGAFTLAKAIGGAMSDAATCINNGTTGSC